MPDISFDAVATRLGEHLSLPAARLRPTTPLAGLVVDSFELVELVIDLQEEYGVRFSQAELGAARTLGDLLALLQGKHHAAQA